MEKYIQSFRDYLIVEKKSAKNTTESYMRDITQFSSYCASEKITDTADIDSDFINKVDMVLNGESASCVCVSHSETIEFKDLKPREQELLNDIIFLIKERFTENNDDSYVTYKYLLHFIQGLENVKELKYILTNTFCTGIQV